MSDPDLHPLISAASRGELPEWAVVDSDRRTHLESVARLMREWARTLGLGGRDQKRWAAAAWLHDALRGADPRDLAQAAGEYTDGVRHGPATAARLEAEGVDDDELLGAIRHHTLGHRRLQRLGRYLYLADYLDPSRSIDSPERAELLARLPDGLGDALRMVCARRIAWQLERGHAPHQDTVDFCHQLSGPGE